MSNLPLNVVYRKLISEDSFWSDIEVRYEKINDEWEVLYKPFLKNYLIKQLNNEALREISQLVFNRVIIDSEIEMKEQLIESLILAEGKLLMLLRDFQNQRKKAIDKIYEWYFFEAETRYDKSPLAKLLHLYRENYTLLFDIYTMHKWIIKGTGDRYELSKKLSQEQLTNLLTNQDYISKLTDSLYTRSKEHQYKVVTTANEKMKSVFILIFKQTADSMIPDFDKTKRHKQVTEILFGFNTVTNYLEIKCSSNTDKISITKYFSDNFLLKVKEIKDEPFKGYSPEKFKKLFTDSQIQIDPSKITVTRVDFTNSLLTRAPKLSLQLLNDDVWPAVQKAQELGAINFLSLTDIESLQIISDGTKRTVRTIIDDNGDVIFQLQDGNLSDQKLNSIKDNFSDRFGIPLNQPVSNILFDEGLADKVDVMLTQLSVKQSDEQLKLLYKELISKNFITESNIKTYKCSNKDCNCLFEQKPDSGCPECGEETIVEVDEVTTELNLKIVKKHLQSSFKQWAQKNGFQFLNITIRKIFGTEYQFMNLDTEDISFGILVTSEIIPTRVLNRISKIFCTPIIIVYVGLKESDLHKYKSHIIYPINFGKFYVKDANSTNQMLDQIYNTLKIRMKSIIAQSATDANDSLSRLIKTEDGLNIPEDYSDAEFEDDVFAIIHDIFPNADKWGKEMSGERMPEGIFCLQYNIPSGTKPEVYQQVYSFDCKFTETKKGYDLNSSEKRKALDYISELNSVRDINKYGNNNQLAAHIFISNNFRKGQIDEIKQFISSKISSNFTTRAIFIEVNELLLIHSLYRVYYHDFLNRRNDFYEELAKLLNTEDGCITNSKIQNCFSEILSRDPDFKVLDLDRIREKLKRTRPSA